MNEELRASLRSLQDAYGLTDATGDSLVVGTRCEGPPVCALAIAPFQTEPWT